jgi:hypothetical protein
MLKKGQGNLTAAPRKKALSALHWQPLAACIMHTTAYTSIAAFLATTLSVIEIAVSAPCQAETSTTAPYANKVVPKRNALQE